VKVFHELRLESPVREHEVLPAKGVYQGWSERSINAIFFSMKNKEKDAGAKERAFKYYPEDFGDLAVKVLHMDLDFDVYEDKTVVKSGLWVRALKDIDSLSLNAKELEILGVKLGFFDDDSSEERLVDGDFQYRRDDAMLDVNFDEVLREGKEMVIRTESICRPTDNILEGLYFDETPKNCPCQQITQCQQWGFQRIVPCIDDMTAKCTYLTTITADERYTNMISNGDVDLGVLPEGEAIAVGPGRAKIAYKNVITPMATYLFFLGVGSYATFRREFEYPNGDKFMLELLVPPSSDEAVAEQALQVLHDGIMWIYLFTGRDKYENLERAAKMKDLVERREMLKDHGGEGELAKVREELAVLDAEVLKSDGKWGYKYTGTVYREIGMQNSDFGGMENVGNTTITTNRIMPFPEMTDGSFEYMIRVKVHEFYHNLNGSEVTGRSPFEIWLNEAVTVFIEQEYHEFLFGEEYARLDSVLTFLYPGRGTFAGDDSVAAMPIEPDGFNDCNELITGVTYVKAPEFVKMIETLMGPEVFVKGLALYHARYKHSNASRAQWVEAMEEASGMDFQRMAQTWLKQAAYPKVDVVSEYDEGARRLVLKLKQRGFKDDLHWEFPFAVAACGANGEVLAEKTVRVMAVEEEIVFEDVDEPAFLSLNRGYSFFGKVFYAASDEELYLQVRQDADVVNRYMAFYALAEKEKMRLLEASEGSDDLPEVDERFVDLYFELFSDEELMARVSSQMLCIFEFVEDERFAHAYDRLYEVVKGMKTAVARKYEAELRYMYEKCAAMDFDGGYVERKVGEIKARQLKNTCLGLLSKLDREDVWEMIKAQYEAAECATDKVVAFSLYINSAAPDKMEVLADYEKIAKKSLVSWESFLACVARNDSEDAVEIIEKVEKSSNFRISQANDQRALYGVFAGNRKKSLLTAKGRKFLAERIAKLAPVNEYSTLHILKTFGNIDRMEEKYRADLVGVLVEVRDGLDMKATPSAFNTIERILKGSPKGVKAFEEQK
jgi:aminopeptidase N